MAVYRKRYPKNSVSLSSGKSIKFEDFGEFGFFITEDPKIISEFDKAMAEHRGGVQLSSKEEYDEAIKKKPTSLPSQQRWNETQTAGLVTQIKQEQVEVGAAPATGGNNPLGSTRAVSEPTTPPEDFSPRVGKRKA